MPDSIQPSKPQLLGQAEQQIYLANARATQMLGQVLGQLLVQGFVQIASGNWVDTNQVGPAGPASFVLLLSGNLGSGKTTFVQGLGLGLGIRDDIVSPTFTLVSEYPEGKLPLYHFDLYRLQPLEVEELAPETYWEGSDYPPGVVAIEWAERLPYLPNQYLEIELGLDPGVPVDAGVAEPGRLAKLRAIGQAPQQLLGAVGPALELALSAPGE